MTDAHSKTFTNGTETLTVRHVRRNAWLATSGGRVEALTTEEVGLRVAGLLRLGWTRAN